MSLVSAAAIAALNCLLERNYIFISLSFMKNWCFGANSLKIPQGNVRITNCSVDLLQQFSHLPKSSPLKKNVVIPSAKLDEELRIYDWRAKTEFPIVRIQSVGVLGTKNANSILEITGEACLTTLADLHELPLFKMLYLLK